MYLTARDLVEVAGVSDATVVQLAQSLGLAGCQDLKLHIALAAQTAETFSESTDAPVCVTGKVHATYDRAVAAIRNMQTNLPLTAMTQIPRFLQSARCIYVLGAGTSRVVAGDAYIQFTCLGLVALHDHDSHSLAAANTLCRPEDAVLSFSHSGNTVEVVRLLEITRADGARTIAVTSNGNSRIAALVDHILATGPGKLPFHSLAITSRII